MKIEHLELKNYRNCKNLNLIFDKNKVLIVGKNAQGKTNILESIYYLSSLKSPRISNSIELINFDELALSIYAHIVKSETDIDLNYIYNRDKQRVLKVNGLKATPKNFKCVLKTVLFSSNDLLLLRGVPSDRRDWLDRAISQIYPAYDERLVKYDKIQMLPHLPRYLQSGIPQHVVPFSYYIYNKQAYLYAFLFAPIPYNFHREIHKFHCSKIFPGVSSDFLSDSNDRILFLQLHFRPLQNDTMNLNEFCHFQVYPLL